MESEENFSYHQSTIDGREFHEKRYQTHKNEISHFAIETKYQIKIIFTKKIDLIQIYGILKSAPFCLQSNALRCLILIQRQ